MSTSFTTVAELSNFLAIIVVLSCCFTMMAYLFRFHGDTMFQSSSVTYVQMPKMAQPMVMVHNPFIFKLNSQNSSLKKVHAVFSTQVPCVLHAMWGVSIQDFHLMLNASWQAFWESIQEDNFFTDKCLWIGNVKSFEVCEDHALELTPHGAMSCEDLGPSPRLRYPLVVVQVKSSPEDSSMQTTVMAMITVIHIKDELCSMDTGVLSQYLKQANGQTSCLRQLYFPSADEPYESCASDEAGENQESSFCVVCQAQPVSYALLPCRHACVCQQCLSKLDKCPLCRGVIQSYFSTGEESPIQDSDVEPQPAPRPTLWQRLERANDSLNTWLGFAERN